jgi:hypothetical protein
MAAEFTLAVALMQPLPLRMLASRNDSLPENKSKPWAANRSSIAFALFQSPDESPRQRRSQDTRAGALDQGETDRHLRHRRDVVQVNLQAHRRRAR